VPPGQPYHFSGGPDYGPSNLIDWGSFDWQPQSTGTLDPTKPGGPGSFEQALELTMMTLWDKQGSAPSLCNAIQAAGQNGDILLNSGLRGGIWSMLAANAGALVPLFLAWWNAHHTTGTLSTEVECTQALCQQAGGTWFGGGDCGANGVYVQCNTTAPAPQRMISYTVGSAQYNDPLSIAFEALAQIMKLPSGGTLALPVNSGPLGTTQTPPPHIVMGPQMPVHEGGAPAPAPAAGTSVGTKLVVGTALVAGAAAGGVAAYAAYKGETFTQTLKRLKFWR
jgi:hypothetical protein